MVTIGLHFGTSMEHDAWVSWVGASRVSAPYPPNPQGRINVVLLTKKWVPAFFISSPPLWLSTALGLDDCVLWGRDLANLGSFGQQNHMVRVIALHPWQ